MKQNKSDNQKAFIVKKVADSYGVEPRYVYMVLNGERNNDEILNTYIELYQETTSLVENKLLAAANSLVPFG